MVIVIGLLQLKYTLKSTFKLKALNTLEMKMKD